MAKKPKKSAQEDDQYLVEYVKSCQKNADDATRGIRNDWKALWQAYQNKQSWKKKDWQAKVYVPKLWMKIERATGEIKRALSDIDRLWKFELDDDYADTLDDAGRIAAEEEMNQAEKRFKNKLKKTNFPVAYAETCKSGFITGLGVPKVLWDGGKAKFENVECSNTYICPDYQFNLDERPEYIIEEQEISLAKLRQLAKKINSESGEELYDMAKIGQIEGDFAKDEKEAESRERKGLSEVNKPQNKRVTLTQFWGDITDKEGTEIKENQLVIMANGKYIIRKQENPFLHQRPPYPLMIPIVYPHRGCAGVSLIGPSLDLQKVYNNALNLILDNANWVVNKMFTYNSNRLMNPKELFNIYPGKMIPTNVDGQAMNEVGVTSIPREMFLILEVLEKEIDEGTAVTEFLSGMPDSQAKTLGEIQIKTAQSKGIFDTIAKDLEQNSIKPLLEMTYSLYQQFAGFPEIQGKYNFVVGGLTIVMMEREKSETMSSILGSATQNPELRQRTDIDKLWQKMLGLFNLSDVYQEAPMAPQAGTIGGQVGQNMDLGAIRAKAIQDAQEAAQQNPQSLLQAAR